MNPHSKKLVLALIGPKGAGKSHVGYVLEKCCGIKFLNVEKMGLENIPKSNLSGTELIVEGFHLEEKEINRILSAQNAVSFENTGAHEYFFEILDRLRSKYEVKLVRVFSPLDTCYNRIKLRNANTHIPVSEEMIKSINEKATKVNLKWNFIVDNSDQLSEEKIVGIFQSVFNHD